MSIRHAKTATGSPDRVGASDWDAVHTFNGTPGKLLGADGAEIDPATVGGGATSYVTPEQFGAIAGVNTTAARAANDAAFLAACQHRTTAGSYYGDEVRVGPNTYYLGVTLEPEGAFRLIGQSSGATGGSIAGTAQTRLIWPTNTCCIRVRASGTDGTGLGAGKLAARDSVIRGLSIEQLSMGTDLTAHGVHMRGNANIYDCMVVNIAGDGFNVTADSSYTNATTAGFADDWRIVDCMVHSCGGNGFYSEGSEANAGYTLGVEFHQCGGCAIFDQSKFPNAHYSPQITGYGSNNPAGVSYGGHLYQLISVSPTDGGATTPGTNNAIWYDLGTYAPTTSFPAWVSGAAYLPRLPFLIVSGSPIYGIYQESGRNIGHSNGVMFGGVVGGTSSTNAVATDIYVGLSNSRGVGRLRSHGGAGASWPAWPAIGSGEEVSVGGLDDINGENGRASILRYRSDRGGDKGDPDTFAMRWVGLTDVSWELAGRRIAKFGGRQTADTYGRSTPQPGYFGIPDLGLIDPTDSSQSRIIGIRGAVPNDGVYHARGEFVFNSAPSSSGTLGWSCTASGTPGTWTAVPVGQFTSATSGWVPLSGGGATNFLRADGTWAAPPAGGSSGYTVVSKSATYTETTTSGEIIIKASGTFTINLPTAVGNTAKYHVKLVSAGTVTIDAAGTETLDGGLTASLSTLNQAITFVSDNANWQII